MRKPGTAGSVTMAGGRKRKQIPVTTQLKQTLIKQAKTSDSQTSNSQNKTSNLCYDKNRKLSNEIEGEKHLIVHRTDDGFTMKDMSPILLEQAFKTVTNNGKISCRTLKSGDILIKTENLSQAKNLISLTRISQANIEITEHKTLNSSKGVVSAYELKYEEADTLLEYLKPQNVTKIDFHMKNIDNERVKTGLVFVTFGKNELPEFLTIGCLRLRVRAFIPPPTRCFVCHKFGHISKGCPSSSTPKCFNCNEEKHLNTRDEKCTKAQKCANCGSNEHNSYNRTCTEYKRQTAIQTVKVTQRVSFAEAVKRTNLQRNTYAQVTASDNSSPTTISTQCKCPHCGFHRTDNYQERIVTDYGDLNENVMEKEPQNNMRTGSAPGREIEADGMTKQHD